MAQLAVARQGKAVAKIARPLLSSSNLEARRRVINLYRAWMREVPHAIQKHALDITTNQGKNKVREIFRQNANVKNLRLTDMLYIKGRMELEETHNVWKQGTHVMRYFNDNETKKQNEFLSRFFVGYN